MKLFNILLILLTTFITTNQSFAQSREDERRQANIDIEMLADIEVDGTLFKVAKVGGDKDFIIVSEYFISDQFIRDHNLDMDRLNELDLVDLYETLFIRPAPFKLIDALAEKAALELEAADWELVNTPQLQGDDCLMPGENPPPVWPQDINLPPCPEPEPEPIGKEPNPPEPTPPGNGKPLPGENCWSENGYTHAFAAVAPIPRWHMNAEYDCTNFQGSAALQDVSHVIDYKQKVAFGKVRFTGQMKKNGSWVGVYNKGIGKDDDDAEEGWYDEEGWYNLYISAVPFFARKEIKFKVKPDMFVDFTYYHWHLELEKMFVFGFFPIYPKIECVIVGGDC